MTSAMVGVVSRKMWASVSQDRMLGTGLLGLCLATYCGCKLYTREGQ